MNRRLYNNQSFVETAIYRVFLMIYRVFLMIYRVFTEHKSRVAATSPGLFFAFKLQSPPLSPHLWAANSADLKSLKPLVQKQLGRG
jgi:hypothetical protein